MYYYSKENLHSILHGTEVVLYFTGFFKSLSLLKVLPFKLNKSFTNERFMSFAVVHSFLDPLFLIVLILWCWEIIYERAVLYLCCKKLNSVKGILDIPGTLHWTRYVTLDDPIMFPVFVHLLVRPSIR